MRVYPVPVDLEALDEQLKDQPAYRARQVWEWLAGGAKGYDEMTNIPVETRARLEATGVPGELGGIKGGHAGHRTLSARPRNAPTPA